MNSLFDAATLHPSGSLRSSMSASLPFCLIDDMSELLAAPPFGQPIGWLSPLRSGSPCSFVVGFIGSGRSI